MKRLSCAFTGHRPQKLPWRYDESSEGCMLLKEVFTSQIAKLMKNGVTDFLSGMTLGVDTICSELIPAQREKNPALRLHCILPCVGQDAKWSDYLLAVYNGEQRGGTAATVRYAKNSGRKIILIAPITRRTTYLRISSERVQS